MIPRQSDGSINFDRVFQLYKGSEARPVHNQKEYDKAVADGFGDYVPQEFPRWIYHQKTNDRVKVFSAEEEAAKTGYGRVPIAIPKQAEEVAGPQAFVPKNDIPGAIQALERRSDEQAKQIEVLVKTVESLLTELGHSPKKDSKKAS